MAHKETLTDFAVSIAALQLQGKSQQDINQVLSEKNGSSRKNLLI